MTKSFIHPTAIVEVTAIIGDGNYIGPYCHIYNGTVIGNNNHFEGYVSVGSPAEKHGFFNKYTGWGTIIGDKNIFREFVTINSGTNRHTQAGSNCVMLRGSHLSHDTILEDNVTVS